MENTRKWKNNKIFESKSNGGGPVDATFKAIEKIVGSNSKLQLYSVNNITDGTDSLGEVTVRIEKKGIIVNGIGSDTDIVIASAKAYLDAINKLNMKEVLPIDIWNLKDLVHATKSFNEGGSW